MIKGVLFDFWGTLVEQGTYSTLVQSYRLLRPRMAFSPFVVKFEETIMKKKFEDQKEGFEAICKAFDVDATPFLLDQLIGIWNKNKLLAKPYPETVEILKELKAKGLKLALVSNSIHGAIEAVMEKFDLAQYFDGVYISSEIGLLKQEPECFKKVLKDLKLKKTDVLMVGDSLQTDIAGAEAVGIKPILIDRREKREYENKIKTLKELDKYL